MLNIQSVRRGACAMGILTIISCAVAAINPVYAGTLTCTVSSSTACTAPSVSVMRLSGSANAQGELGNLTNSLYNANVVCCSGVSALSNSCTGTNAIVLDLSSSTNAHGELSSQINYATSSCLAVPAGGSVSIGYQATNCTGFDTTLLSVASNTNAHMGDGSAYTTKVCGTAVAAAPALAFSISTNSIGFGTFSTSASRFATSNGLGSGTEGEAHTLVASTTAPSGYTITVQGGTLTDGINTISAIGATNTAPVVSVQQFGLRAVATGGTGTVTAPYATSGFAYAATASTSSQVAGAITGDGVNTTYSLRYLTNIAPETAAGSYTTGLMYVITANF